MLRSFFRLITPRWMIEWVRDRIFRPQIIPANCFIQQIPDFIQYLGWFPDFKSQCKATNNKDFAAEGSWMWDGTRWMTINLLLDQANKLGKGDFAELGIWKGYTARLIFKKSAPTSNFYCFDTFDGFRKEDLDIEKKVSKVEREVGRFGGLDLVQVRKYIADGQDSKRLVLCPGFFPDTFHGLEEKEFSFVHLDCDLYQPTLAALKLFWPRMVKGGIILMHDYNGSYAGIKIASDEFFGRLGITPVPVADKAGSAIVIK